jgi:isovaleryl-CoA dehydrogenase
MDSMLPLSVKRIRDVVDKIALEDIKPKANEVDKRFMWPKHSLDALSDAGLMGLNVPKKYGGMEQGLTALGVISETIGRYCPSSALCYAMHCVGSAVISGKVTQYQGSKYLKEISKGNHITTLALSESGTGSHFYYPETNLKSEGENYILNGEKDFITNGSRADSYVISTKSTGKVKFAKGMFNCLILDDGLKGIDWKEPWHGFGMRGNSSRGCNLSNVKVLKKNLLGAEGDQDWYIFEIVAPYFLMAMAGTYLGIAQSAYDIAVHHLKSRKYSHSGTSLADVPVLQAKLGRMFTEVQKTRGLIYDAALKGDQGHKSALVSILACKADAGRTAVDVTNDAMTLCGGAAYAENSFLARLLRDARASHVMAPTTTILEEWVGRTLLGIPILPD